MLFKLLWDQINVSSTREQNTPLRKNLLRGNLQSRSKFPLRSADSDPGSSQTTDRARDENKRCSFICWLSQTIGQNSLSGPALVSQARFSHIKTGRSGDIRKPIAVPVERTECNFCCVINHKICVHLLSESQAYLYACTPYVPLFNTMCFILHKCHNVRTIML